jgi:hypothetical protein
MCFGDPVVGLRRRNRLAVGPKNPCYLRANKKRRLRQKDATAKTRCKKKYLLNHTQRKKD